MSKVIAKFLYRKNFRFQDFRFKIRFKLFWINSDLKKFDKNFLTLPFFHHFGQKMTKLTANKIRGKILDFKIFSLKYVSKYPESIAIKNFSTKFFWLWHFLSFWPNIVTGKNFRFRDFRFKIRFKPFWIDSDQKKFLDQHFLTWPFFIILAKKWLSPRQKFCNGKNLISRF